MFPVVLSQMRFEVSVQRNGRIRGCQEKSRESNEGTTTKVFRGFRSFVGKGEPRKINETSNRWYCLVSSNRILSSTVVSSPATTPHFSKIELNPFDRSTSRVEKSSLCLVRGSMSITRSHIRLKELLGTPFRVLAKQRPDTEECSLDISACIGISGFRPDKTPEGRFVQTSNGVTRMQPRFSEIADSNVFDIYLRLLRERRF